MKKRGFTGRKHTEAAKAAIGNGQRGRKRTPEEIEKSRKARLGTKHSDESKQQISQAQKARWALRRQQQ